MEALDATPRRIGGCKVAQSHGVNKGLSAHLLTGEGLLAQGLQLVAQNTLGVLDACEGLPLGFSVIGRGKPTFFSGEGQPHRVHVVREVFLLLNRRRLGGDIQNALLAASREIFMIPHEDALGHLSIGSTDIPGGLQLRIDDLSTLRKASLDAAYLVLALGKATLDATHEKRFDLAQVAHHILHTRPRDIVSQWPRPSLLHRRALRGCLSHA